VNVRRLSGWLSLAAVVTWWLALDLEHAINAVEDELEQLRDVNAALSLELASARAGDDD